MTTTKSSVTLQPIGSNCTIVANSTKINSTLTNDTLSNYTSTNCNLISGNSTTVSPSNRTNLVNGTTLIIGTTTERPENNGKPEPPPPAPKQPNNYFANVDPRIAFFVSQINPAFTSQQVASVASNKSVKNKLKLFNKFRINI